MIDLEKLLSKKSENYPWDNEIPIIAHDNGDMEAYITDQIQEPMIYNELVHKIRLAPASTTITLHINTPGGIIDSALMIIDAIKATSAKVVAHLNGSVMSAGTIIALSCDDIIVGDHITFMIHNYSSSGIGGKGHELKAYQQFMDNHLNNAFTALYEGFLTEKEMASVIDGQDLWMEGTEVMTRWAKRKDLLATKDSATVEVTTPKRRGRPKKIIS